jgi:formylglycine-generating enzyme required for sulfatase activity
MGSPDDEPCRWNAEGPVHSVTITRPFYMKQTEVTQKEWSTLISNNPSGFRDCGEDCPVENVSWYDAVYYANRLSETEGLEQCYTLSNPSGTPGNGDFTATVDFEGLDCKGYRLPTEAEWEYATRAGTKTAYWIGSNIGDGGQEVCWQDPLGILLPEAAWYGYNSDWTTHPVGQMAANPFGLYDVHGNVWEWVYDWFDFEYYQTCAAGCKDPRGPDESFGRVYRGGSWSFDAWSVRAAYRDYDSPGYREYDLGFRLARSLPN